VLLLVFGGCRTSVGAAAAPRAAAASAPPSDAPSGESQGTRVSFLGVLVAPQTVDVAAQLDGRIREIDARPGDSVAADAAIARLDVQGAASEIAMAQAEVLAARATLDKARLELAQDATRARRRSAVVETTSGAVPTVSGEELESARYAEEIAQAQVASAQAVLREKQAHLHELETIASEHAIRAPFSGTVSLRYVDVGATVHKGQSVIKLIESAPLRVRFAVPESYTGQLRPGARVSVFVGARALDATVEKVAPEVDAAARAVFAEARLEETSPADIRSGQQVRVVPSAPSG
jgi:RND family efflux transporter MFP subunit